MSTVGSWARAQETGGRLGRRDRAELVRQGVLARLGNLPGPWRRGLIAEGRSLTMPIAPDTSLAREAEQRVRELSDPVLYRHCLRTWAFAALFAEHDRVAHDEELLDVACVLHDLMLDVVGRRLERLPTEPVSDIVARWPRAGSGDLLLTDTKRQAKVRPQSRAALLHKLGFTGLVSANPLDLS